MDRIAKYRKIAGIAFPIAIIALIGTSAWAIHEKNNKEVMETRVENQYRQAFGDLNHHIDVLEDGLGKTLAINSRTQLSNSLENVWRLSYAAASDLSQLPIASRHVDDLTQFINNVGNFAYSAAVRDLEKKPLSEQEYTNLKKLYAQARTIQKGLQQVENKMLTSNINWLDAEVAAKDKSVNNSIVGDFKGLDTTIKNYPELEYGQVNNWEAQQKVKISRLKGTEISANEARTVTARFLGINSTSKMTVTLNTDNYKTYTVRVVKNDTEVSTDVTKVGGYVIDMTGNRPVPKRTLTVEEAEAHALQFLNRINHKHMVPISYSQTGNTLIFTFVHEENGIRIYPEMVSVNVALDNGEILGFDGDEYVFNQIVVPKERAHITPNDALKRVSPELTIQEKPRLALVYNEATEKILCYEILGYLYNKNDQYRIFINAKTGQETFVEKLKN